jgi:hypothetical protein
MPTLDYRRWYFKNFSVDRITLHHRKGEFLIPLKMEGDKKER